MIVINRLFAATGLIAAALLSPLISTPIASAAPCPDVELVFARGTFEPPGVGGTGEAFVDSLRSKLGSKSLEVYPVEYPASLDFQTAADGVIDASNRVQAVAAECPKTKIVLGGFSQGAAVAGYLTADSVPVGFAMPAGLTGPMPPEVADHVAAVALFGKPSSGFLQMIANTAPPITVGHLYAAKTADLCIPEDPICSPGGGDTNAHNLYPADGLTDQAAEFVVQKISSSTPATTENAR
ncbi:cutinase family protein [Mycolicibacterium stellerae]|uniref:cutinase family protein n=1 Tax=Mycolicibacterium stellerae TaxID=2358193 RepID=UPI000F0B2216|nr:cutinase family protein [Mycolicibacterium stellerae]